MTIKELKKAIEYLPDDMDVFINQQNDELIYSYAENASIKQVRFIGEGIKKIEEPTIDCFVISDLI